MGDVENGAFTERENEEFYFKQLKNLQVFDASDNLPLGRSYLLAVSNRYGLCFAGCPVGFKIIKTSVFGEVDRESGERSANAIVTQYPSMYIDIGHLVCHIAISSDDVTLSVCYEHGDRLVLRVYDIPTLALQGSLQGMLGEVVLMSSPGKLLS
ncbi:Nuclear pore complex protein Nup214 [Exaiptasia diaphana]|nr:Nuclear pore complex protein Nup214 [Exaiptasia diaphana]